MPRRHTLTGRKEREQNRLLMNRARECQVYSTVEKVLTSTQKMAKPLCRICLRTGFERTEDIDERLAEFHNEICDYDVFQNSRLSYCRVCEYKLRKFYNFKLKCRRAHNILKSKKAELRKQGIENLHQLMPPVSITVSTTKDRQAVYSYTHDLKPYLTRQCESGDDILVEYRQSDQLASEAMDLTSESDFIKDEIDTEDHMLVGESYSIKDETVEEHSMLVEEKHEIVIEDSILIEQKHETVIEEPMFVEVSKSIKDEIEVVTGYPMLIDIDTENIEFKQEFLLDNNKSNLNSDCGNDDKERLASYMSSDSDDEKPISRYVNKNGLSNKLDRYCNKKQIYSISTTVSKKQKLRTCNKRQISNSITTTAAKKQKLKTCNKKQISTCITTTASKKQKLRTRQPGLQIDSDEEIEDSDLEQEFQNSDLEDLKVLSNNINVKMNTTNNSAFSLLDELSPKEFRILRKSLTKSDKKIIEQQKKIMVLKNRILQLIDNEKLDLGDNIILTKERFLDMFAKCDKSRLQSQGLLNYGDMARLKKFLLSLINRFNPEYETVFEIQYLITRDMKLAEFDSRKESKEYLSAEFKCPRCYKGFELQSLLDYHMKWHEESRPHVCDICSMRFDTRTKLTAHARTYHYSVYHCKLCVLVTYSFSAMVNHYHQHKGKKYTCTICLGEYRSKSALNTHMLTHATIVCAFCARRFVTKPGLHNHVKMKHQSANESPHSSSGVSCDKCSSVFKSRAVLQRHVRLTHDRRKNPFTCSYSGCFESFNSAGELLQHAHAAGHAGPRGKVQGVWGAPRKRGGREARVNVTGPDKYRTCPVCGEQVKSKTSTALYLHHVSAHPTAAYAFVDVHNTLCEQCGKTFVHPSTYQDHLNTHSGARPYACSQCGARFAMKRSLYTHRERHLPPRHECKLCGKKFFTSANLFSHTRSHVGDRRFKCEICSKGFLHASALTAHVNGVHNHIRRPKRPARK